MDRKISIHNYNQAEQVLGYAEENVDSLNALIKLFAKDFKPLKTLKLEKYVGGGSYGSFFVCIYRNKRLGVKIQVTRSRELVDKESLFSNYMSDVGIGPLVYEDFFLYSKLERNRYGMMTFIFSELYDTNLKTYIRNNPSIKKLLKTVDIMKIKTIQQMFLYNMVCIDIKPDNFVYKLKKAKVTEDKIKMIDFGVQFCKFEATRPVKACELPIELRLKYVILMVLLLQIYITVVYHTHLQRNIRNVKEHLKSTMTKVVMKYISICFLEGCIKNIDKDLRSKLSKDLKIIDKNNFCDALYHYQNRRPSKAKNLLPVDKANNTRDILKSIFYYTELSKIKQYHKFKLKKVQNTSASDFKSVTNSPLTEVTITSSLI